MKTGTTGPPPRGGYARRLRGRILAGLLGGSLLLNTGCPQSVTEDPLPDGGARPLKGWVVGRIKDPQGNPMTDVLVYVQHARNGSAGMRGTPNANGRYKVPVQAGSWHAYASLEREYNGRVYQIDLHPDTYEAFDGDGAVRNFAWKLTGEKPSGRNTYYGGSVQLTFDPTGNHRDIHNVDVTFTPVGPLIDGSAGQALTRSSSDDPLDQSYSSITDVPIGRYRITAVYRPTGKPLQVRSLDEPGQPYQDAPVVDFFGHSSPRACTNCMALQFPAP